MNNTDKVYLIKWVGPFSYDELYNWEKKWLENNNENFNLYLLQGKRKYARKFSYYCGQTIRCVYRRLKDRDHHFKEIEHSDYSIWIGKFSNVVPNKTDINVVEKIITSELAELELGFENMMNEINLKMRDFRESEKGTYSSYRIYARHIHARCSRHSCRVAVSGEQSDA